MTIIVYQILSVLTKHYHGIIILIIDTNNNNSLYLYVILFQC
jgi:hypothetical protein